MAKRGTRQKGFTFVELLVVTTILLILASAIMPLARVTIQRQRETELHRSLREMRTAIDKFKDAADAGAIAPTEIQAGSENYPPDAAAGRVDIAIARTGDQTGASGAGLLAALLFDAIAPGTTAITVTGVANGPDGAPVQLTFAPVTVTVR